MRECTIVQQFFALFKLMLWVLWPVTAFAAQLSFSHSFADTDVLLDVLMTIGISVLVGLTSLLVAMKAAYEKDGKIDRLWLFVSSKMLCSTVAGITTYFCAGLLGMPRDGAVIAIIGMAYCGTVAMERLSNAVMEHFVAKV
jgi:hypothetical protein